MAAPAADEAFAAAVRGALAVDVAGVLAEAPADAAELGHRHLAARVRALVAGAALGLPGHEPAPLLARTLPLLRVLRSRQNPSGLFAGGDNVDSPPDSAFSANDLADAATLLGHRAPAPGAAQVRAELGALLDALTPPLLAGGVHTPNHRWELAAALARLLRLQPPPELAAALRHRVRQWLAEGVDADADGLYSERSPNYASAVSDPSLLLLAEVLERPDLLAVVERSLAATLDLLLPDGRVETVHSRRQDQRRPGFPLAAFVLPLRAVATATGRGDLAWGAREALAQGLHAAGTHDGLDGARAATALLLDPRVAARLPPARPPAVRRRRRFASGPLVDHRPGAAVVVAAGGDRAGHGRVRSGLACDPTFLRVLAGSAVLDGVRLSRTFFGLGPFRAQHVAYADDDAAAALSERVAAAYYQPLPAPLHDPDGAYAVEDDGRFSAAMAFGARPRDEVVLTTAVDVALTATGVELAVEVTSAPAGPAVDWLLELALRPHPGGVLAGAQPLPDGRHRLDAVPGARATWTVAADPADPADGADVVVVEVLQATDGGPPARPGRVPAYEPGEEYGSLGGTDAATGELLVLTGRTPGRLRLRVEALPGVARPRGGPRAPA